MGSCCPALLVRSSSCSANAPAPANAAACFGTGLSHPPAVASLDVAAPAPHPGPLAGTRLRPALLLLFLLMLHEALILIVLLHRALLLLEVLRLGLQLRLVLLLFVAHFHGFVPRAAHVVEFWLQRRSRVVCRGRLLHCRIVRRTTRRPHGFLCHGSVLPNA